MNNRDRELELRRENDELRIRERVADSNGDYEKAQEYSDQVMANWREIHELVDARHQEQKS